MAKYTISYADYVRKGGEIPASFADIDGFETLFLERYADREIGFETEDEFAYKLQLKADLWIPDYKERLAWQNSLLAKLDAELTKTSSDTSSGTSEIGAQRSTSTALPFNSTSAEPNQINKSDASTNTTSDASTHTETESMRAAEIAERMRLAEGRANLLNELLDKFDTLFMGVY